MNDCCRFDPVTLRREQRELVLNQIKLVLQNHYVHLSQKEELYEVNIVQGLERLLEDVRERNEQMDETQFSRRLVGLLRSMRDRHLDYVIPYAQGDCVAHLPFLLAEIREDGRRKYIVSAVMENFPAEDLVEQGAEIVSWNGRPISHVLAEHANGQPGCSEDARRALAVRSLPMRALPYDGAPEEDEVTVDFVTSDGTTGQRRLRWNLAREFDLRRGPSTGVLGEQQGQSRDRDIDTRLALLNLVRRDRFTRAPAAADVMAFDEIDDIPSIDQKRWLRARYYRNAPHPFGYIRILMFPKGTVRCQHLNEFVRLFSMFQEKMPTEGLVLDIRSNPGGAIQFADCLLQMLTAKTVEPPQMQLRNTEANRAYCSLVSSDQKFQLERWVPRIEAGIAAGDVWSAALDMPVYDLCKYARRRQAYFQPVVLITNALSYSAADMFAAGFQDHAIGPILGVHGTTGAGGANKMYHDGLSILGNDYRELPQKVSLSFPLLRTLRTGCNEGRILEDYGVQIDANNIHELTRNDIIHYEMDLIRKAASLIGL